MLDKDKSKLPVAMKDVVIIGVGVLVVWVVIWASFGSNPFYVVSSGSMEPKLQVNDVLIVRNGGSWGDLKVGDIIVFNRPEAGTDFPIKKNDYIGRVVYVVPGIGVVTKVISPPVNYIIIAIILAILFFNRLGRKDKGATPSGADDTTRQPPT
ncbi:MAG: S26 family signal peptidase [Thaumarchaeota archaeon]|nr:MAG: S26 family signal peptidase [Nitrososphaerota archaeon]